MIRLFKPENLAERDTERWFKSRGFFNKKSRNSNYKSSITESNVNRLSWSRGLLERSWLAFKMREMTFSIRLTH
jgi:hypothetical protein